MAPPIGYVAYIDEAGDDGLRFVAPLDPKGASEWFVIGAFVVPISEDAFVRQWLQEALNILNVTQRKDIHFVKLSDYKKELLCSYLASLNFRWFVAISHKPNMRQYRNTRAELVRSKNYFYNWMARILLERVTAYCSMDAKTRHRGQETPKIRIEFSQRGGMFYNHTKDYFAKLWAQSQGKTLVLTRGDLSWDVVDVNLISYASHKIRAGLQLADVVTSAFYQGLTQAYGKKGKTDFVKILKPRVASGPKGVFDFGVKLLPDHWQHTLRPDQCAIFELFGAPRK